MPLYIVKIIHMRLAARNVYLNKSLSAKIAGFGPRQGDDEDESGKKVSELGWRLVTITDCIDLF